MLYRHINVQLYSMTLQMKMIADEQNSIGAFK